MSIQVYISWIVNCASGAQSLCILHFMKWIIQIFIKINICSSWERPSGRQYIGYKITEWLFKPKYFLYPKRSFHPFSFLGINFQLMDINTWEFLNWNETTWEEFHIVVIVILYNPLFPFYKSKHSKEFTRMNFKFTVNLIHSEMSCNPQEVLVMYLFYIIWWLPFQEQIWIDGWSNRKEKLFLGCKERISTHFLVG